MADEPTSAFFLVFSEVFDQLLWCCDEDSLLDKLMAAIKAVLFRHLLLCSIIGGFNPKFLSVRPT